MQINYTAARIASAALGTWFLALHMYIIDDGVINTVVERGSLSLLAMVFFVSMCALIEKKS